ncbi:MAG: cupin domain-containing protein [Candidatus Dormibacteraeota bacterium]|nr:cupin domain-containing protein [Candidatus Dormibacteraeota bacterium]
MKVIKAADRLGGDSKPPTGKFHGRALQRPLLETEEESRVSFVRFELGAHNHWHTHSGGQLIHVVEGHARVQPWGEEVHSLSEGDTAICPPGEKHWHGAGADGPMTHLVASLGAIEWLEEV